jgi:flavin-dependent dehydrogenase
VDAGAAVRGEGSVTAEVVVIGGGLAGTAAAIRLARAGRAVTLVERTSGPQHKVCGEFLSAEALDYLLALGVEAGALGAVPIRAVRIAGVTRRLPFRAMSLTRCSLDEELLRVAAEAGVTVLRGSRVDALLVEDAGWCARLEDGNSVMAPAVFLATGKHDLRAKPRPKGRQAGLVGMKMYFRLEAEQARALQGCVELMTYRGGYAGLQPVEGGVANLCCLIERGRLRQLGGRWEDVLGAMRSESALLRERLEGATAVLEKPLAVAPIPYGYVRRRAEAGLWALGDQAAVIPSFTGDGMSIALHSGFVAAAMYLAGESAGAFQRRMHGELKRQVALATAVSRGLVSPVARPWMLGAVRVLPGLMSLVAEQTRVARPITGWVAGV